MREIQTKIQISAPIDKVWQVLTDFEHWKDWNPIVKQASGTAKLKSKLNITMMGNDCKEMTYSPCVTEVDAPRRFRWRAKMMAGFIFTNDRVFELSEKDGGSELINKELFSGLMVSMSWKKMQDFVPPMLEKMNQALKEKLESV